MALPVGSCGVVVCAKARDPNNIEAIASDAAQSMAGLFRGGLDYHSRLQASSEARMGRGIFRKICEGPLRGRSQAILEVLRQRGEI